MKTKDSNPASISNIYKLDGKVPVAKAIPFGIQHILAMFESRDVKPIEAVGVELNPDLHNAVMHVEDESVGENIIIEEFQKGYTYRDSVVRYSMVKVAN